MLNNYLLLRTSVEAADLGILFLRTLSVDSADEELISMLSFAKSAVTIIVLSEQLIEILKNRTISQFFIFL